MVSKIGGFFSKLFKKEPPKAPSSYDPNDPDEIFKKDMERALQASLDKPCHQGTKSPYVINLDQGTCNLPRNLPDGFLDYFWENYKHFLSDFKINHEVFDDILEHYVRKQASRRS